MAEITITSQLSTFSMIKTILKANSVIGIKFKDHHKIMVNIDNLFDHDYYEKKGFPKPGIGFTVGYRYSF